jgi:small-conductance mechanosensitive channel
MQNELNSLWHQMLSDLREPDLVWQMLVLVTCLGLAKLVERLVNTRQIDTLSDGRAWQLGRGGLRRVAFPLVTAALVLAARPLCAKLMSTHVLSLALPLMFSLAGIRMVFYVLRHSFSGSAWLGNFERAFAFVVWGLVAMHIVGILPAVIDVFESVAFTIGKQKLNLWQIIQGIATVLATVLAALWVGGLVDSRLGAATGLDVNLKEVLSRISKAVLVVVAVLISLPMVGIDLTTLSVFGGALGVGLGLGLQKIASNYVSGFIILLDRSIRIGNIISVESQRGEVTRITTRYTVLRSQLGIESLVPNEQLIASVVQNESYSDRKVRLSIGIQVAYDNDVDQAMALMLEAVRAQSRVLAEPPPSAWLKNFAESGIDLELGFWIQDPEEGTGQLRSDINREIWQQFKGHGIGIPFPQREVRIINTPAVPLQEPKHD